MRFGIILCTFVSIAAIRSEGATLTFSSTTDGGTTFLYNGSVQNNQQVDAGDFFVVFDFAGLTYGSGPSPDWLFSIQTDVPGQPDSPLIPDAIFTYAGSTIVGQPGQTPLGIFTLKTTITGQQQGLYIFETTRTDGGNAGNTVNQGQAIVVAADTSVPEPNAMLLVGGGLSLAGLAGHLMGRRRTRSVR